MKLVERRAVELQHGIIALRSEFQDWRKQSNPHMPLEKHHSQIVRITNVLEAFLNEISVGTGTYEDIERLLTCLMFAHRTWAYFKSKLALRSVKLFQDTLACMDEFAWECYQPVRQQALQAKEIGEGELKEPPLSYFSGEASPFVQHRDTPFDAEGITSMDADKFGLALSMLPVPIIGVPWHHVNHVPSTVVVAHEVGHAVERDFQLADTFNQKLVELSGIGHARRDGWRSWRSELFADLFGILCTGPACVIALVDYLIDLPATVMNEQVDTRKWGKYPIRSLRMEFNLAVLDELGLEDAGLRQRWREAYPHQTLQEYEDFCKDAGYVAHMFLSTPIKALGNVPIAAVVRTTADDWASIKSKAEDLVTGTPVTVPRKRDDAKQLASLFRLWMAAATLAYYDRPDAYVISPQNQSLFSALAKAIPGGIQRGSQDSSSQEAAKLRVSQNEIDIATGKDLLNKILTQ
jgi:hypothetical protein